MTTGNCGPCSPVVLKLKKEGSNKKKHKMCISQKNVYFTVQGTESSMGLESGLHLVPKYFGILEDYSKG